ncbi:MAG: 3-oxoacyl-ACP synthase [Cyclobacteriaceae bacterium]
MSSLQIKQRLHSLCLRNIEERINTAEQAIAFAQSSANEETKSSAGDKYETGRAMAQLEIEKNSAQLLDAKKLKQQLLQLDPNKVTDKIQLGSLVITNQGNFYISIPSGKFTVDDEVYFAISPSSPIAQNLIGLKFGDKFSFNKKEFTIDSFI